MITKIVFNYIGEAIESTLLILFFFLFVSGCHAQGNAGNIIMHGICVRSVDVRTRCSASHIQIGQRLACLNLLAMQPSTPISAYHHIKIIHTHIIHVYTIRIQTETLWHTHTYTWHDIHAYTCYVTREYMDKNILYAKIFSRPGGFLWKIFG